MADGVRCDDRSVMHDMSWTMVADASATVVMDRRQRETMTVDIYCPKCGEPIDMDYIHDVVAARRSDGDDTATWSTVAADYRRRGCPAVDMSHNADTTADPVIGELYGMLGDDMDGAAAMMEDMDMMDRLGNGGRW